VVEVDAGSAAAVLEAAGLAPEADALRASRAGRGARAAPRHFSACPLLVVVTAASDGIEVQSQKTSQTIWKQYVHSDKKKLKVC
jgi:hypothetical protein